MRGADQFALPKHLRRERLFGSALLRRPKNDALRLALLSLIRANWGPAIDAEKKLDVVENALLGRWGQVGPKGNDLDDVFIEVARLVSLQEANPGPKASVTSIVRGVLRDHAKYSRSAHVESIIRDVVRKFSNHRQALVDRYGVNGQPEPIPYALTREAMVLFEKFGLEVDWTVLPPAERKGDSAD